LNHVKNSVLAERHVAMGQNADIIAVGSSGCIRATSRRASLAPFPERPPNTRHGFQNVATHQFSIKPQHAVTKPPKHAVPARVCGAA
jgi:hypothetical protein